MCTSKMEIFDMQFKMIHLKTKELLMQKENETLLKCLEKQDSSKMNLEIAPALEFCRGKRTKKCMHLFPSRRLCGADVFIPMLYILLELGMRKHLKDGVCEAACTVSCHVHVTWNGTYMANSTLNGTGNTRGSLFIK